MGGRINCQEVESAWSLKLVFWTQEPFLSHAEPCQESFRTKAPSFSWPRRDETPRQLPHELFSFVAWLCLP